MKVLSISNQKGGVGKSTTVNALGAGLYRRGYKVLYIDLDAQGNLTYSVGITGKVLTSMDVLTGKAELLQAIIQTPQGDIVPAGPSNAYADMLLNDTGKEYKLKEALSTVKGYYDFVLLDTPPALNTLNTNALAACDMVLIPAQADIYSIQGIGQLEQVFLTVKKYCNKDVKLGGFILTRYNGRTALGRDVAKMLGEVARRTRSKVFEARIRECIALKEAQLMKQDIFTYAPRSNAAADYNALVEELLRDILRSK